jgi:hypothetical protein
MERNLDTKAMVKHSCHMESDLDRGSSDDRPNIDSNAHAVGPTERLRKRPFIILTRTARLIGFSAVAGWVVGVPLHWPTAAQVSLQVAVNVAFAAMCAVSIVAGIRGDEYERSLELRRVLRSFVVVMTLAMPIGIAAQVGANVTTVTALVAPLGWITYLLTEPNQPWPFRRRTP